MQQEQEHWDLVIKPKNKWYDVDLAAIWHYRDLLMLLVRRDFVAVYKQTILGPLWFFIQPIFTSLTFTLIFGGIAKISTDSMPPILFYMAGVTLWRYFSDCLNNTSNTFIANAGVFGKVYFPRLIMPLSVLVSNLIKLGIQLLIFLIIWLYYLVTGTQVQPQWYLLLVLPLLILMMAGLGLGFGILISSLTTKYRDLSFLIGFGVQLLMYGSSVIIPVSSITNAHLKMAMLLNPLTSIIEAFKYIFLGSGFFSAYWLIYDFAFMMIVLAVAVLMFNKVEKTFMDTV
ncbi:MAG: ABC transporter permease [Bacteroidetes bacterium]|nr:ABC transporter permease [Bacteroidota bacterium]